MIQQVVGTLRKSGFKAQKGMMAGYQLQTINGITRLGYWSLNADEANAKHVELMQSVLINAGFEVSRSTLFAGDVRLVIATA